VVEDLELGEVGLPQLVHSLGGLFKLLSGRHHLEDRALDQVEALQDAIHAGFRDEIALLIGEKPGDLPGRFLRMGKSQGNDLI
jgi:hypothetical protein